MKNINKIYEGYWEGKQGMEKFTDYERNLVIKEMFKKGEKVLDLACGEGAVAEFIKSLGCEVTAFDISSKALEKVSQRGVEVVQGDVEKKLPFEKQTFDTVFWGDNVEHLFSPEKTLGEIKRILKPAGRLILSCPNMGYWRYRLYYLIFGMVPQTEWCGKNPWQWEHIRFFNERAIEDFLDSQNFMVNRFWAVSKRRLDQPLKKIWPALFGMIMVVEARINNSL